MYPVIVIANSLHSKGEDCWHLMNEPEQARTGVEESDRAFIYELSLSHKAIMGFSLLFVCPHTPITES